LVFGFGVGNRDGLSVGPCGGIELEGWVGPCVGADVGTFVGCCVGDGVAGDVLSRLLTSFIWESSPSTRRESEESLDNDGTSTVLLTTAVAALF
jgi:hypothetical protein